MRALIFLLLFTATAYAQPQVSCSSANNGQVWIIPRPPTDQEKAAVVPLPNQLNLPVLLMERDHYICNGTAWVADPSNPYPLYRGGQ